MKLDVTTLYAAFMHELKNNLGLLAMTIDAIPLRVDPEHDTTVNEARLLCQGVVDRLQQALLIYKAVNQQLHPSLDAYSPHDLVRACQDMASSLSRGKHVIESRVDPAVPEIGFFDRSLVEMALINALHNSLQYARSTIRIESNIIDGYLAFQVRDDSDGYPTHILESVSTDTPYRATGTGLGLQLSSLIAQAHTNQDRCGELRLHNDHGAVFSLLLP